MAQRKKSSRKTGGKISKTTGRKPPRKTPRPSLAPDALARTLVPDASDVPSLQVLAGLFAESDRPGYRRVYVQPDLSEYVEFAEADVVHRQPAPRSPLGGSIVWVEGTAKLTRHSVGRRGAQHEYLRPRHHAERWTFFCAVWVTCPIDSEADEEDGGWTPRCGTEPGARQSHGKVPSGGAPPIVDASQEGEEERTPFCPPPDDFA